MKIAIIGAGYVGLVSGACLADFGHEVTCIDLDQNKVALLLRGEIPIFEPGLDRLVADNVAADRLKFAVEMREAVRGADAVFIAVGTPTRRGDGHADLTYVYAAAESIAAALDGFTVVITKSTVPVGTGDEVERIIRARNPQADFAVASNPEFLREGAAIEDFKRPDRIVVGVTDPRARDVMANIYRPLYLNQAPILFTDRRTAELTKYAANAFLAMKITFINEIADLCEAVGADVQEVARGIGLDKRIGGKFLHAGPGYGGSCFPKDTLALIKTAQDFGQPVKLIETTAAVNEARKAAMAERVAEACGGSLEGKTIAVLGLTFKPNTDDLRDAPALTLISGLQKLGARVKAYDPEGMTAAAPLLSDVVLAQNPYEAAVDADALVIVTEWDAFRALNFARLKQVMVAPLLIDLRNVYRLEEVAEHGFSYRSIGRPQQDFDNPQSSTSLEGAN
jgi:UDPglucose 6-dehydrogenase